MRPRNILPIILISLASFGAFISNTSRPELSPHTRGNALPFGVMNAPTLFAFQNDRDAVAVHDMTLHAIRHLNSHPASQGSFGVCSNWTPDWELRWMAFGDGADTLIVYHATLKRNPSVRFTFSFSPELVNANNSWQIAR
jgi:hypothetical protein